MDGGITYWERKQAEVDLLCQAAGEPTRKVANAAQLVGVKQFLRARLLGQFFTAHQKLTESNLWSSAERIDEQLLRWRYLRFDQRLFVPVKRLYPALAARVAFGLYAASGMSAISAALETLDEDTIAFPIDGYFETLRVAGRLKHRVIEGAAPILYVDSMCREERTQIDGARVVVFDTTCYDCESPRISALVERCRAARIPCVLLRSHLKLDCLALEYGRLGSMVVVLPDRPDRAQVALAKKLRAGVIDRLTLWGAHFSPEAVFPLAREARPLERARVEAIVRNQLRAGSLLAEPCAPTRVETRHHGCFLILRPLLDSLSAGERYLNRLVEALRKQKLFVREAPSFGYDLIGLTQLRVPDRGQSSIRLSLPDFSDEELDRAIAAIGDECATWLPTKSV